MLSSLVSVRLGPAQTPQLDWHPTGLFLVILME